MARFVATQDIAAPVDRVFAYRRDVTTLPEYNPDVTEVRAVEAPEGAEAAYTFRLRMGPGLATTATLSVHEVDAPRRLVFRIESLMAAEETCTFEEIDVDGTPGTRVRFETNVVTSGGPMKPLIDAIFVLPNLKKQTLRELRLMKANLER